VLRPLEFQEDPRLLVGLQTSDDAAVYRLDEHDALVQTVDFFPPVVDDAYLYGAIAAANALSDVYAMGGEPFLALNIAAWPNDLTLELLTEVFRGGLDKAREAGVVIAGGHTITDDEPKYGLVVTGRVDPARILTKAAARPGELLYLTKPIGTGAITTALKAGVAEPGHVDNAVTWMVRLNRTASQLLLAHGVRACTDVTGYGLAGHASEIALKSGVRLVIAARAVPIMEGAEAYARAGRLPGGAQRNRAYYTEGPSAVVRRGRGIPTVLWDLLFDPVTSGGLLFTIARERAPTLEQAFAAAGEPLWRIGFVDEGSGVDIVAELTG
jgi:selenide,water dikinase